MNGYLLAVEIVEKLPDDQKMSCIKALKQSEQGQNLIAGGEWRAALSFCRQAESEFAQIPTARSLLGIVKSDIATALGNLGQIQEAKKVAMEALPLVESEPKLRKTTSALHMNIGLILYQNGDHQNGARHFSIARNILRALPDGQHMLNVLDANESNFK